MLVSNITSVIGCRLVVASNKIMSGLGVLFINVSTALWLKSMSEEERLEFNEQMERLYTRILCHIESDNLCTNGEPNTCDGFQSTRLARNTDIN
jgi:hypothetical protein